MSNLDKLIAYFENFPGIGARQARRFAFHLLTLEKNQVDELAELIGSLQGSVAECESCHRFFTKNGGPATMCNICGDYNRDHSKLVVVERDSDIVAMERSGTYDGMYFVVGGTIPLLDKKNAAKLRTGALKSTVEHRAKNHELTEIVMAFAVNPDGENTTRYLESVLKELIEKHQLTVTQLGRGLSTGSELEYADPETLKNAWQNRH